MQMRAGRKAGRSHITDHLALPDLGALGDTLGDGALVVIGRDVAIGMADQGLVTVTRGPSGLLDGAVARRDNRRTAGGGPVGAGMHAAELQNRVAAHAET